jgi:hypothetical protein
MAHNINDRGYNAFDEVPSGTSIAKVLKPRVHTTSVTVDNPTPQNIPQNLRDTSQQVFNNEYPGGPSPSSPSSPAGPATLGGTAASRGWDRGLPPEVDALDAAISLTDPSILTPIQAVFDPVVTVVSLVANQAAKSVRLR